MPPRFCKLIEKRGASSLGQISGASSMEVRKEEEPQEETGKKWVVR